MLIINDHFPKVAPKSQHFRKIFSTTGGRSLEEGPMVYL